MLRYLKALDPVAFPDDLGLIHPRYAHNQCFIQSNIHYLMSPVTSTGQLQHSLDSEQFLSNGFASLEVVVCPLGMSQLRTETGIG